MLSTTTTQKANNKQSMDKDSEDRKNSVHSRNWKKQRNSEPCRIREKVITDGVKMVVLGDPIVGLSIALSSSFLVKEPQIISFR